MNQLAEPATLPASVRVGATVGPAARNWNHIRDGRRPGRGVILGGTDARPSSDRRGSTQPPSRHPRMARKKSKGVLARIGDAVKTGAEAVADAGSKAVEAVGDLMPTG